MAIAMINETMPALMEGLQAAQHHLWELLDRWMELDESRATWEEVEELYREIVALWHAHPDAAEAWHTAWRAARSARRP